MSDRLLTVRQLTDYIPWEEATVYSMVSRGELPKEIKSYKLGGKRVFKLSEVQKYIANLKPEKQLRQEREE